MAQWFKTPRLQIQRLGSLSFPMSTREGILAKTIQLIKCKRPCPYECVPSGTSETFTAVKHNSGTSV